MKLQLLLLFTSLPSGCLGGTGCPHPRWYVFAGQYIQRYNAIFTILVSISHRPYACLFPAFTPRLSTLIQ